MDSTTKQHFRSIATLSFVLAVLTVGVQSQPVMDRSTALEHQAWSAQLGTNRTYNQRMKSAAKQLTPNQRIAQRLQQRLRSRGNRIAPPLSKVVAAVEQRQKLLGRHFEVNFDTEENQEIDPWVVSAQRYPLWIKPEFSVTQASFDISPGQIKRTMEMEQVVNVEPPQHAILRRIERSTEEGRASKAVIEGIAKPGYMPDPDLMAQAITKGFASNLEQITVPLNKQPGRIINMTGEDLGDLSLWAQGLSNYRGSTYARQANVRKALEQHVNNTLVMPGETFSFNSTLGGRVTQANGWHMAKVIYNGGDLEYAPGGGICQASTTTFRAIVNAGFPVVERRAHSLYVSYYEKHGVGIDATIYPGTQDLTFLNDSESPVIIQAYSDGYDAHVNLFGTPDSRTVQLEGPYFASTAPEGFTYKGRAVKSNEIVWVQRVTYPDGKSREYTIGSRYKTLPQSLANKYPPEEKVHASAPLASMVD